ncbi:hypothetical protein [Dyella acidisoli]|uniref:Uncharacterized protein n=1 Tax=Dyella acidisoli TaxID=1867834 RepID=A0ABQ5XQJ1_9GAMM|nr:hypothetical protein [Dyella acidisoli]GLQ92773.1 hypothetical protein GCM10007901_17240 [Dyella acidisoli]
MSDFPQISRVLKACFNVEDGLSEDVAIRMYQRALASSANRDALEAELARAFGDTQVSWKKLLLNDDYEVFDAPSEEEMRAYAHRILWQPIFGL